MNTNQTLSELREKMIFMGYAPVDGSFNLNAIAEKYQLRYEKEPLAFMARSPFGVRGSIENRRKLVISQKHCGANTLLVPLILGKEELEYTIMALGEVHQKIYVDRRKAEKDIELSDAQNEAARRTFSKHCPYCGIRYIADVASPEPSCGGFSCREKHREHIALQKEMRSKSMDKAKSQERVSMPDFDMDTPGGSTLQGYVYCIRAENGLCKIGRSNDVENRFGSIVTASPVNVYLEHTVFSDNYVLAESYIHARLDQYRHHGEWFNLPEEVFDWFMSLDNYDLDDA